MQHRVMEQEYGGFGSASSPVMPLRSSTLPVSIGGGLSRPAQTADVYHNSGGSQQRPAQLQLPPGAMAPMSSDQMSWLSSSSNSTSSPTSPRSFSPPSPPPTAPASLGGSEAYPPVRPSRSPPQHNQNRFAPSPIHMPDMYTSPTPVDSSSPPSRARSASAAVPTQPPAQLNGKLRKNITTQAVMANGRKPRRSDPTSPTGEEEDVPLAVWQQRRR
jgi:hypothetical protein